MEDLIIREVLPVINNETNELIKNAVELQQEYGSFIYNDLGLIEAKEAFYTSLENFPGIMFQRPLGSFYVAYNKKNIAIGIIGVRIFNNKTCEMKRFYIKPDYRRYGFGKILLKFLLDEAKQMGYTNMVLDTDKELVGAIDLYKCHGFVECEPYNGNVNPNVMYLKREL